MTISITIKGIQEAQQRNQRRIAALRPSGTLGRAIQYATVEAHRYATAITHVWHDKGGALRASHRMQTSGDRGRVYIGSHRNPRGGRTDVYGPQEHARGGEHAFYRRTVKERGREIGNRAAQMLYRELR